MSISQHPILIVVFAISCCHLFSVRGVARCIDGDLLFTSMLFVVNWVNVIFFHFCSDNLLVANLAEYK